MKGPTGAGSDDIFMTKNEVDLHINEKGKTGIVIVSNIQLNKSDGKASASGGKVYAEIGWDIGNWALTPMAFKVSKVPS